MINKKITKRIYIRSDGANINNIGMGHLFRTEILCRAIEKEFRISPIFIIRKYHEAIDFLLKRGLKFIILKQSIEKEAEEIVSINGSGEECVLIVDNYCQNANYIRKLKSKYFVISFNESGSAGMEPDIVINSFNEEKLKSKNYFSGAKYFLLKPTFKKLHDMEKKINFNVNQILVLLGGSDANKVNFKLAKWLSEFRFDGVIKWVIGPAVIEKDKLQKKINELSLNTEVFLNCDNIDELLFQSDISIIGGGFSIYENACVGTPGVALSVSDHQIHTIKRFEKRQCILNGGHYRQNSGKEILSLLDTLINNLPLRIEMSRKAKSYIDGNGLSRILKVIANEIGG